MRNYFNFKRIDDEAFLVTNDFGRHLFLTRDELAALCGEEKTIEPTLRGKLEDAFFLLDPMRVFSTEAAYSIREMKRYLFSPTALHIFVVTNACNLQCAYCQAQADKSGPRGMMSLKTGKQAVDIALQSPAECMTFEFQGGEPLCNYETIRDMIEYAEKAKGDREVKYTVVSNLSLLTDGMMDFFSAHNVSISTSLDGPALLHDQNRKKPDGHGSYQAAVDGIRRLRERGISVGAIQTTTRASLGCPKEIVREYEKQGLYGVFLRPLSPLGYAQSEWKSIGYTAEEFLEFYQTAFQEVLTINQAGKKFPEMHASYFLKKILCGTADNYMELRSPCGAGFGQLAYYHDGKVYTCDEARMVAESGNDAFCLGTVYDSDFRSLVASKKCYATSAASVIESLPGCCDCVYQPYCGVCPVVNFAMDKDPIAKVAHSYRCRIYEGILDYLFSLLRREDKEITGILTSWVMEAEHGE